MDTLLNLKVLNYSIIFVKLINRNWLISTRTVVLYWCWSIILKLLLLYWKFNITFYNCKNKSALSDKKVKVDNYDTLLLSFPCICCIEMVIAHLVTRTLHVSIINFQTFASFKRYTSVFEEHAFIIKMDVQIYK